MTPPLALILLALILLTTSLCASPARAQHPASPFPQDPATTAPERTIRIQFSKNEQASIVSYRFKPGPGLTQWFAARWCGVTIQTSANQTGANQTGAKTSKPLLVIGTGETETLTCLGLKEAGPMPPAGAAQQIGLIYRTASPNFAVLTPILLVSNPSTGDWTIDHTHDEAFSQILPTPNLPTPNLAAPILAAMRRILSLTPH